MATLYWGGGAGTWSSTDTTHWYSDFARTTLAGVAPTSADNVIFDSASNATAYAVTIGLTATPANCADVSISGPAAGNVTVTSAATSVLNVFGSWLNAATGVAFTSSGNPILNFLATTTGKTVTTNNITLGNIAVNFTGIGGGWTLGSAFSNSAGITSNSGTFDTGNFAISTSTFATTSATTRSILLGSSAISISNNVSFTTVTGLTFDSGTSTITCYGASVTFTGGDQTFYNVNFNSATAAINTVAINGNNDFNNLNVTTTALQKIITLGDAQTVNGTLTLGATNTAQFRMSVVSSVVGSPRALVVENIAALSNVDFRDIVAAGTSAPWSGTRIGDCLGNSNIDTDASKFVYWNLPAGGIWTDTAWALTSGGAVAVNNFPLPQDFVIIEDTGLNLGVTININTNADIGYFDMTARTIAFTLALGNTDPKFYSDLKLCSTLTTTGASSPSFNFLNQGLSNIFESAGVVLKLNNLFVNCPNGSLTLQDNITVELTATSSGGVGLTAGTFDINGFNLTAVSFNSSNALGTARTLTQGSGGIAMTGGAVSVWNTTSATGLTYTTRPVVNFTYAGSTGNRTITTNAASIIDANITAGTDNVILATAVGNLNFTGFAGSLANSTRTIYGDLTLASGMTLTSGALVTTFDRTSTQTITSNGKAMDFPVTFSNSETTNCLDALTLGSTRALTFTGGTLNLAAGTTSTVGAFVTTGTSPKFLGSTTVGTQATISDASGTNTVSYITIKDSNATGGAVWDALSITNIDAGDNTGWLFSSGPRLVNEITMRLRSFAQPRRF